MAQPYKLYVFADNNKRYGLTANTMNNTITITRFNFGNDFTVAPSGTNLGNIGNLNAPTGLQVMKDINGGWSAFVTNATSSTLSRLNFGSSLLNTPTGINFGNLNNAFINCWDIQYCQLL